MANLTIPLIPNPYYSLNISLDDNLYKLQLRWNYTDEAWIMNIESLTSSFAVSGIKLVTGIDLLEPYAAYEMGRMFMVDLEDENLDPTFDDIGTRFVLVYVEK